MSKEKKPKKMYLDPRGNEIPSDYIHKTERDKHSASIRLHKKAVDIHKRMADFKKELIETCDALYAKTLEENRITVRENSKGGYSISTVDKALRIEVTIADSIHFNDKIDLAQAKIREYLSKKTKDIDGDISMLINEAFKAKRGRLDKNRILSLLKLNITDLLWKEAMALITQSIEVNNTKRYFRILERDPEGQYNQVVLDFASI
jgi:hypothetical protein